tara:strand:- start:216 stop:677 length:462 start_codon:yes stop_codon:yes gene_type:complete
MTTTLKPSTLTVNISESVYINGVDRGGQSIYKIDNIVYIDNRILTITTGTGGTGIISFASGTGSGIHDAAKVKYIRFTNLDDTYAIVLNFLLTDTQYQNINLPANKSFIIGDTTALMDPDTDVNNFALVDIVSVQGISITTSSKLEIYIASIA